MRAGRQLMQVSVGANVDINQLINQIASAANQPDRTSFVKDVLYKASNAAPGYNVLVRLHSVGK
jgi:hypothetical protein